MKPDREVDLVPPEMANAIRALPAAVAGPGFGAAVLSRAAAAAARRKTVHRRGFAVAAALGAVVLGFGLTSYEAAQNRAARRTALVDEHRRLQSDLDALRELADRRPLIPLGGDAATDHYLDLSTVPAGSAIAPAVTQTRRSG